MVQSSIWVMFHSRTWKEMASIEFVGNPTGIIFVATSKDHIFTKLKEGNSKKFRKLIVTENSSNLIQIAPSNPSDTSHPT